MHMEALDRSFSTSSETQLGMYPISPEPRYNDCLSPQYSPIQYDEQLYDLPCTGVTPESSIDSAFGSSSRTPLSSVSSFSSDSSSTNNSDSLSSSHCSGLSEIPSLSSMSISSSEDTPPSFYCPQDSSSPLINNNTNINCNPFSVIQNTRTKSKSNNRKVNANSSSHSSGNVRRSSAPARGGSGSKNSESTRKDSFVYDVQLESDNVLLFVPDLDLVKSHLMFAVREEVDVLKERIGELMERINHLEYENTVLKKYATPETLQQLQHPNP